MKKTIDPTTHAALDYALSAAQVFGPEMLGLPWKARSVSTMLGTTYGATTALTDTPLGVKPAIPFATHGAMEIPFIASMVLLPWMSGATKTWKAKLFFLGCVGMAITNFLGTDFNAQRERTEDLRMADVSSAPEEALAPLMRT